MSSANLTKMGVVVLYPWFVWTHTPGQKKGNSRNVHKCITASCVCWDYMMEVHGCCKHNLSAVTCHSYFQIGFDASMYEWTTNMELCTNTVARQFYMEAAMHRHMPWYLVCASHVCGCYGRKCVCVLCCDTFNDGFWHTCALASTLSSSWAESVFLEDPSNYI